MMQYSPLDSEESPADDKPLIGESLPTTSTKTRSCGFTFFIVASVLSVVISLLNITILSASQTYRRIPKPLKTPSVYLGLDRVNYSEPLCRAKTVYPEEYWTFKGSDIRGKVSLATPEDRTIISFGGDVSLQPVIRFHPNPKSILTSMRYRYPRKSTSITRITGWKTAL